MLSIVCPVYNEAANVDRLIDALARDVRVPAQLLFVYDFDEDTTLPALRARMDSFPMPIALLRNTFGRGVLNAVKSGLLASSREVAAVVIMADLADELPLINDMYPLVENGTYDVVCGSRYMKGGRQIGGPPLKSFLSRAAGLSLRVLSGIPTYDATNNYKMYRGSFLAATPIESTAGFELALELVVKAYVNGYRVGELPTTWTDRVAGESRFDLWKWMPHYLRWYWYALGRGRLIRHPMRPESRDLRER